MSFLAVWEMGLMAATEGSDDKVFSLVAGMAGKLRTRDDVWWSMEGGM